METKKNSRRINDVSRDEAEKIYETLKEKNNRIKGRTLTKICSSAVAGSTIGTITGYFNSIFNKTKNTYQTTSYSSGSSPTVEFVNNKMMQYFPDLYNKIETVYENIKGYGADIINNITDTKVYTNNSDSISMGFCVALGISALVYLIMDTIDHTKLCRSLDAEYKLIKAELNN